MKKSGKTTKQARVTKKSSKAAKQVRASKKISKAAKQVRAVKKASKTVKRTRRKAEPIAPETQPTSTGSQAEVGGKEILEEMVEYTSVGPLLSGGDVDASWQGAEDSGEESVGGHAPTPDQDIVDEIGRAAGIELQDNQELLTHEEILARRDRHRWELDRRSADTDFQDEE
jgi:hypothetical protein